MHLVEMQLEKCKNRGTGQIIVQDGVTSHR
ncbi:hypothetical protein A6F68_01180 [Tsuneonella dongtanensis]|uniref:Uncharacterized protein n=1 Tax=Tsuneonella dongtanensis TaxID=692370 RepID=A0A1B2AC78_9SPHN|nr:hypothetical protein A6F68_01180 [Tsuneonella dongtanensis]